MKKETTNAKGIYFSNASHQEPIINYSIGS